MADNKLLFEDWLDIVQEEINIELAETGADREMDFNLENEYLVRYNKYLSS